MPVLIYYTSRYHPRDIHMDGITECCRFVEETSGEAFISAVPKAVFGQESALLTLSTGKVGELIRYCRVAVVTM
jgi:hypothetical protein